VAPLAARLPILSVEGVLDLAVGDLVLAVF
jgi:hypothetical protein